MNQPEWEIVGPNPFSPGLHVLSQVSIPRAEHTEICSKLQVSPKLLARTRGQRVTLSSPQDLQLSKTVNLRC